MLHTVAVRMVGCFCVLYTPQRAGAHCAGIYDEPVIAFRTDCAGLGKLKGVKVTIENIIHSQEASRGDASACFSKPVVYFLANFRYDISKKVVAA